MVHVQSLVGAYVDLPLAPPVRIPAGTAGSANDYEYALFTIPDLTQLSATNKGVIPYNAISLRAVTIVPEAAVTGASAHFYSWLIRQYRAGTVLNQVNTTSATTITAGSGVVVTPASMQNIVVGSILYVSGGTGTAEYVVVTAVSYAAGTFTATFANNHSGAYTIVGTGLAQISYNGTGVTETAYAPRQLKVLAPTSATIIQPGDVLTIQRLSNDATGLASPAATVQLDYVSINNLQPRG
jgi:hypothetical protein